MYCFVVVVLSVLSDKSGFIWSIYPYPWRLLQGWNCDMHVEIFVKNQYGAQLCIVYIIEAWFLAYTWNCTGTGPVRQWSVQEVHWWQRNVRKFHITGFVQDCSNSIAKALELLQSCTKPSMWQLSKYLMVFFLWNELEQAAGSLELIKKILLFHWHWGNHFPSANNVILKSTSMVCITMTS